MWDGNKVIQGLSADFKIGTDYMYIRGSFFKVDIHDQ